MAELIDQLPSQFDIDEDARNERVRRRLAGTLRHLDHRIRDLQQAEDALAAERAANEQLRSEVEALRAEAAAARQEYQYLISTKTFRLAQKPRQLYRILLRYRDALPRGRAGA